MRDPFRDGAFDRWLTTQPEPDEDALDNLRCRPHNLDLTEHHEVDDEGDHAYFECPRGCHYPSKDDGFGPYPDGSEEEWPVEDEGPDPDRVRDEEWDRGQR